MVRKNGMKCPSALSSGPKGNQPLPAGGRLDSSRFSGQMSEHNKSIREKTNKTKKDTPQVHKSHPGKYPALNNGRESFSKI
jgi:hypothetical protein